MNTYKCTACPFGKCELKTNHTDDKIPFQCPIGHLGHGWEPNWKKEG